MSKERQKYLGKPKKIKHRFIAEKWCKRTFDLLWDNFYKENETEILKAQADSLFFGQGYLRVNWDEEKSECVAKSL